MAIWKGLELAKDLYLQPFVVESDWSPIVRKIQEGEVDLSPQRELEEGETIKSRKINKPAHESAQ